jgi:PhnB protein
MKHKTKTTFIPMLAIPRGTMDIDFYKNAFGAIVLRRWNNDDDSVHIAELKINNAMFHVHEENLSAWTFSPVACNGITTVIGLMVDDVDSVMKRALNAGAREISAARNYEFGYRQGEIADPFGHRWLIETAIRSI